MTPERFHELTGKYLGLRIAVLGDFCLDRYLEIDPARAETSLETGLAVHNVTRVRPQAGGAGTIVNNLSALGVQSIFPIGFAGRDAEGFELGQVLRNLPGVQLKHFFGTAHRRTFTYCKPLVLTPGKPPAELNRLDFKNWSSTPTKVEKRIIRELNAAAETIDAIAVLDQVDMQGTGVVTQAVLDAVKGLSQSAPKLVILADSRRGLRGFPPVIFKMNAAELAALSGAELSPTPDAIKQSASALANKNGQKVFVTLAEGGIVGAAPTGHVEHVVALPVRGPIDVVGAGDAVSANLMVALAAGADLKEALELANAAASVVLHKLGTTGSASVNELAERLGFS